MNPYNPNSWDTTSHVNPTLMNNIEQGISNACLSDSLGQIEQGNTSTHEYSTNDCFIFKGQRVKATSNISIGDTIEIGINCSREDIQTEIEDIKQNISDVDLTNGGTIDGDIDIKGNGIFCAKNTTTTNADSYVVTGNNIPTGTEGCSRGVIGLYSNTDKVALMTAPNLTADRFIYLPDTSGFLAINNLTLHLLRSDAWNYTQASYVVSTSSTFFLYGCRNGKALFVIFPVNNGEFAKIQDDFGVTITHTASADYSTHTITLSAPSSTAGSSCWLYSVGF